MKNHAGMPLSRNIFVFILGFFLPFLPFSMAAQPGASVVLEKPKKFENRVLASERTSETKMNAVKKFNQNLNTRYNFFFNANNRLNEIVGNAKRSFKEDYGNLLPFYNYTLDYTASQKEDLDSIIYRCNNGILLHDLRNDWIDDLYFLMGKSYFFQKDFDSARIAFQYINYAWQPRTRDEIGYDKNIGSNINSTGNVYTISTKEKKGIINKAVSHQPVRNDALMWLTRTMIEKGEEGQAWGMIETMKRDVNLPSRLRPELEDLQAYLYYRQEQYDSSAIHLEKALDLAASSQELARTEYLVAQLYEQAGRKTEANKWYDKTITHTTDPVLEAYARISQIRLAYGEKEDKLIEKNIEELMRMAKRDKYEEYRHMIYFAAARMELQRDHPDAAMGYLKKSLEYNSTDFTFKNKTFLILGDLAYSQKNYFLAKNCYDSVDLQDPIVKNPEALELKRSWLNQVLTAKEVIRIEDSLQKIAAMPENERTTYVKNLSRKLRKEKGLASEDDNFQSAAANSPFRDNRANNLFNNSGALAEWYFNNIPLKGQGYTLFRNDWGNRPNVDNWRRLSSITTQLVAGGVKTDAHQSAETPPERPDKSNPKDITYNGLMQNLPLTPEVLKQSNDSVEISLFRLGKLFKDKLEDYPGAIENYESLLNRFPNSTYQEEVLFDLYYCYQKTGNPDKANFYKDYLTRNFRQSRYGRYLNNPQAVEAEKNAFREKVTKTYENVYNLFIEGRFNEALEAKRNADSLYGENNWSPQLLYIESIYYIKQRQDSAAIRTLQTLTSFYPSNPMAAKAKSLIDVLGRRAEIEAHLDSLDIRRAPEDTAYVDDYVPPSKEKETVVKTQVPIRESVNDAPKNISAGVDTSRFKAPQVTKVKSAYQFDPAAEHMVVLVLHKVDVVYLNEAKNALNRYNREKYYNQQIEISTESLNEDEKLVLMRIFPDAVAAADYAERTRSVARLEIFPWLSADKFTFLIISQDNLERLKEFKDLGIYEKFLKESFPGKF